MADIKVSDLTERSPQSTDLLLLAEEDAANYVAAVPTFGKVFYPEWYGAVGDGTTDDTAAAQAAIDAASVDGGHVILAQSYALSRVGTRSFGQYPDNDYALWVNADNVHVWGPGTLVLNTVPSMPGGVGSFLAIAFGGAAATTRYNLGIHGVTVDATALSGADLTSMSQASAGCSIGFYQCVDFTVEHCIVKDGWGYNGAIVAHNISEYGHLLNNRVYGSVKAGMWLDGLRYSHIIGNHIHDATVHGIAFAVNNDNNREPWDNSVIGNRVVEHGTGSVGIVLTGASRFTVADNLVRSSVSNLGIKIIGATIYPTQQCTVTGNTMLFEDATPGGYGIWIVGAVAAPVKENAITGNYVAGYSIGCRIDSYAEDNVIVGNTWRPYLHKTPIYVASWTGVTGNIFTPNYDNDGHACSQFEVDDATPSVLGKDTWQTINVNPTTITMLDNGHLNQRVIVFIRDANTTVDFTGTNLKGNGGADWNPANGDFMVCTFDGTNWYCTVTDTT